MSETVEFPTAKPRGLAPADVITPVVRRLRGRALRYGKLATGIMILIVLVLIGGISLFVLAPTYSGIAIAKTAPAVEPSSTNDQLLFLVSTIVSRAGALLFLVYLVQILVSESKSLLRLASFYSAKADALELVGKVDEKKFQVLGLALSPDAFNFDKLPKTSTEQPTGLATQTAKVPSSSTGKD
jgi:hypothetical protein